MEKKSCEKKNMYNQTKRILNTPDVIVGIWLAIRDTTVTLVNPVVFILSATITLCARGAYKIVIKTIRYAGRGGETRDRKKKRFSRGFAPRTWGDNEKKNRPNEIKRRLRKKINKILIKTVQAHVCTRDRFIFFPFGCLVYDESLTLYPARQRDDKPVYSFQSAVCIHAHSIRTRICNYYL